MDTKTDHLQQLGNKKTEYRQDPDISILETFQNTGGAILVPFVCNEFTSLCPKTGQPDFAKFEIIYVPDKECVESKSLKLYLFSFRNHGDFHEDVTHRILTDFVNKIHPKFIRVFGDFFVRGGISIKPLDIYWDSNILAEEKETIKYQVETWDKLRHFDYL